ncbi:hypothetical protein [Carboxylicivirga taeanensis]|uniref:hypothetical protein n=1 Tax=Carboxylicivirga taeanensis TaxID=1416875 RepID=UPI003F6E26BC
MKRIFTLGLFIFLTGFLVDSFGQGEHLATESQTHIFWQADRKLSEDDFQYDGTQDEKIVNYCDEFDLYTVASVGLFAVLDVPKKKRKRGELLEKVYFAPAFDKTTSFILSHDTLGVEKQEVIFDIFELSARTARQQLHHLQDSISGYGIISMMFKSIEAKAIEMRTTLVDSYTQDVYINKSVGAYNEWRIKIDKLLLDTKEYATKPEDCFRFIKKEPIDDRYIIAKTVVGNLFE